jgi:uncharacterized membrane protein YozB (DUF420 family)
MIDLHQLPTLNATLNGTSAILLAAGYACIRSGKRRAHAGFMIAALIVSAVFLTSYLYYHFHVGRTTFPRPGFVKEVYLTILFTHTILAIVTALWLVPVTLSRALRERYDKHRAIARWTLPIWFYVSVTGVIIYFMLYHWYAHA